jgi:hypothetical protein
MHARILLTFESGLWPNLNQSSFGWLSLWLHLYIYINLKTHTHTHTHKLRGGEEEGGGRDVSSVKSEDFKETAFGGMSDWYLGRSQIRQA